jgi:hypothetical protein
MASPIPVLVPVTTAIAMIAPLGLIKGFDDTRILCGFKRSSADCAGCQIKRVCTGSNASMAMTTPCAPALRKQL